MEIVWNANFRVREWFYWDTAVLICYVLWLCLCCNWQSRIAKQKPNGPQSLKYLPWDFNGKYLLTSTLNPKLLLSLHCLNCFGLRLCFDVWALETFDIFSQISRESILIILKQPYGYLCRTQQDISPKIFHIWACIMWQIQEQNYWVPLHMISSLGLFVKGKALSVVVVVVFFLQIKSEFKICSDVSDFFFFHCGASLLFYF